MKKIELLAMGTLAVVAVGCSHANRQVKVSEQFGYNAKDATEIVQRALDSGERTLLLDRQAEPWVVGPLFVRSDTELVLEEGVELVAKKGEFHKEFDSLITARNATNVTIRALGKGATMRMWREEYCKEPYSFSEHRHIFNLLGTVNVKIDNLRIVDSGGDGIYLGRGKGGATCRNTTITRCDCDRNHRQGISVITANGLLIRDTKLRNTCGTAPKAGIDFEPNSSDEELIDCVMENCEITGNRGYGVDVYLGSFNAESKPISITVRNCRIADNVRFAHFHAGRRDNPDSAVKGCLTYENCRFEAGDIADASFSLSKSGSGYLATLRNCEIVEPKGNDRYVLFPCHEPFDRPISDGFYFDNVTIRQPKARTWAKMTCGNWAARRPTNWRGTVKLVSPQGTRSEKLDAAWCAKTFPIPEGDPMTPLVKCDFSKVKVEDAHPGEMTSMSTLALRGKATLTFYAKDKTARFRVRYDQLKDNPTAHPKGTLSLVSADGKEKRGKVVAKLQWDKPEPEFTVKLPHAGFWALKADITERAKLTVVAADVPVAVDCTEGPQQFIYSLGSASFFAPAGKKVEAFYSADPGEYVGIEIRDSAGVEQLSLPAFSNASERFLSKSASSADGYWTVEFLKPTRGKNRKYFFHVRNVPGYLFLSPDRRWR